MANAKDRKESASSKPALRRNRHPRRGAITGIHRDTVMRLGIRMGIQIAFHKNPDKPVFVETVVYPDGPNPKDLGSPFSELCFALGFF